MLLRGSAPTKALEVRYAVYGANDRHDHRAVRGRSAVAIAKQIVTTIEPAIELTFCTLNSRPIYHSVYRERTITAKTAPSNTIPIE